MVDTQDKAKTPPKKPIKQREWMLKFWYGICFTGWVRLLVRNRFRVGWQNWHHVPGMTAMSVFNSLYRQGQWLRWGWRIKAIPEDRQPLFILGHWRSGTTLLHELLVLDPRHTYPTTYECFAPNHFLATQWFAVRFLKFLLPSRRPMDNMPAGWLRPQEDEFALCNLGIPSPYLTIAFPNNPPLDQEYLTLEGLSPQAYRAGSEPFCDFSARSRTKPKRIILKSPPHVSHRDAAGNVSRGGLSISSRPVCRVPLDGPVEETLRQTAAAAYDIRGIGGPRLRHVHADVREVREHSGI
jgi:hypothetical protein